MKLAIRLAHYSSEIDPSAGLPSQKRSFRDRGDRDAARRPEVAASLVVSRSLMPMRLRQERLDLYGSTAEAAGKHFSSGMGTKWGTSTQKTQLSLGFMVAGTGFEPVTFGL